MNFLWMISSLETSHFIRQGPLKILIHGFNSSTTGKFPWLSLQELLLLEAHQNYILVDWSTLVQGDYMAAVKNAQITSRLTANMIDFLVKEEAVRREDIHLIGGSLGGQVAGQVGSRVSEKLARITALDPASPYFATADLNDRIDASDALFVDVIHTNGGKFGILEPAGTVDFYPNGGQAQAGCEDDNCSHLRSMAYFTESVRTNVGFAGWKCPTWEDFQAGNCQDNEQVLMGYFTPISATGSFFLSTNEESPFARG